MLSAVKSFSLFVLKGDLRNIFSCLLYSLPSARMEEYIIINYVYDYK